MLRPVPLREMSAPASWPREAMVPLRSMPPGSSSLLPGFTESRMRVPNSGTEGREMVKAGSTFLAGLEIPSIDSGPSKALDFAFSKTPIHSISSACVSAWSMMALFLVFTSKQKRRSSWVAGLTLHSSTPIRSLSSTPPLRVPWSNQPKIPFFTNAQRRTHAVLVGFP